MGTPTRHVCRHRPRSQAISADTLADRLDAAAAAIGLEPDELEVLQRVVLPEEFVTRPPSRPTATRPGTAGRITAMAARAAAGLPLTIYGDAPPADGRAEQREWVLMYRLEAATKEAAVAEARDLLGRGRGKPGTGNAARNGGLPPRASVEAV